MLFSAVALILLLLSACGLSRSPAPDRREQLLTSTSPRSVSCVVESYPAELPSVDAVVDSARLAAAVDELRRADPPASGYVLLTLGFDRDGVNIRRDVIEHSTRPLVADSVQRLVFAARRQVNEAEQEWGVRLRIDLTEPITFRVGRREFCPPIARDRAMDEAMRGIHFMGPQYRGGIRTRVVHMRALVSELGIITSAHVVRGELRGSSLERNVADYLRQFLFTPATIDGVPTSAWIEIPVRVRG